MGLSLQELPNLLGQCNTSGNIDDLEFSIDERRNEVFKRLQQENPDFRRLYQQAATLREQLCSEDEKLFDSYENANLEVQDYLAKHEYLQGMLDGIALITKYNLLEFKSIWGSK